MTSDQRIRIAPASALKLIDLIHEQVRLSDSEEAKKILLRAAIRIADLALNERPKSGRITKAA